MDNIIQDLEKLADVQMVSPQILLEKLVKRSNDKLDKEMKNPASIPVDDACALMYNVDLSIQQYQKLRTYLLVHSINLPIRNDVDIYKKTLMCEYKVENTKTYCEFPVLVRDTVQALLKLNKRLIEDHDEVHVEGKLGIDGSGSHQVRHQLAEHSETQEEGVENKNELNYIGVFWCPLSINVNGNEVWSNPLPNSIMYSRPLCLMREKENRESVHEHFKPYIDAAHNMETASNVILNDHPQLLSVKTELSMVDGKMVDLIQGDSGSFCHYCNVTKAQANDITCILQGFVINKSVEEMVEKWDQLESGEMTYNNPGRLGQCHKPMNRKDLRFFAIMHQLLRSLDNCLKILYHLVSGQVHTWSESNANVKDALKAAKKETINHIRSACEFLVDCPTQNGGTTNTGPVAEKFFSTKHRDPLCRVIKNSDNRLAFSTLLSYFNKMLSITQQCDTTKVVNVDMVRQLGIDLMVFYKQNFPFAMISPSIHQVPIPGNYFP